jgi:hypothetical protein
MCPLLERRMRGRDPPNGSGHCSSGYQPPAPDVLGPHGPGREEWKAGSKRRPGRATTASARGGCERWTGWQVPPASIVMADLFISHVEEDGAIAAVLAAGLEGHGYSTWHYKRDTVPGLSYLMQVGTAIEECHAIVLIISRRALGSHRVTSEVVRGYEGGKAIIPLLVDLPRDDIATIQPVWWQAIGAVQPIILDDRQVASAVDALLRAINALKIESSITCVKTSAESTAAKSKGYVFLSYAEEDLAFIADLRSFLAHRGYAYWDYEESDRNYSVQLALELEEVIQRAAATLTILSPAWKLSDWTVKEYLFSVEVGTPTFLIRSKEMGPTLVVAGAHYIDFVGNRDRGFAKLDRELKRRGL